MTHLMRAGLQPAETPPVWGVVGSYKKGVNSLKKFIIKALAVVALCALFFAYGKYVRHDTIVSAKLVEDNGAEYVISFDGENHTYAR